MAKKLQRLRNVNELPVKEGHHYEIRKSIQWFDRNDGKNIRITTSKGDILELGLRTVNYPHLMGLQYTSNQRMTAHQMLGVGMRKSDEDIARLVSVCDRENPYRVVQRATSVKGFLENLENASLVDYNPSSRSTSTMKFEKALAIPTRHGSVQVLGIGERNDSPYLETFLPERRLKQMEGVSFKNRVEKIEVFEKDFNKYREFSFDAEKDSVLREKFVANEFDSDLEAKIDDMVFLDELTVARNGRLEMDNTLIFQVEQYIEDNSLSSDNLKEGLAAMLFDDINRDGQYSTEFSTYDVLTRLEEHGVEVPEKNIQKEMELDV